MQRAGWAYRRMWGKRKFERDKAMRATSAGGGSQSRRHEPRRYPKRLQLISAESADDQPPRSVRRPADAARRAALRRIQGATRRHHHRQGPDLAVPPDEQADRFLVIPGDDVQITVPTAGTPPKGVSKTFTVVDVYESKMSEYDSQFVFVPIRDAAKPARHDRALRPASATSPRSRSSSRTRPTAKSSATSSAPRFKGELYGVYTWQDKQGSLLTAVALEKSILNILLFLIIAVAGFGILAIFYMIVVEKTRDIGILKSLGALRGGIMGIFLGYGLSLGTVGAGAGMALGLLFVNYINEIRDLLEWITGTKVFDPSIYYFFKIPTIVEPFTVGWIVFGSVAIAVLASVLPARRAARLHPVEALAVRVIRGTLFPRSERIHNACHCPPRLTSLAQRRPNGPRCAFRSIVAASKRPFISPP